ncbi:polysaccharide deacetylase family protein [Actinoplanes sp. DH11]|uniref:polysaccharide deacetylase family protein n=1 Tax=Actinoplanes sp. DH11 TaxID=2857011 RepID=UPI001E5EAB45|nr:polysaccharide deacetylase family protein [Actinoplanes sp. DH11]
MRIAAALTAGLMLSSLALTATAGPATAAPITKVPLTETAVTGAVVTEAAQAVEVTTAAQFTAVAGKRKTVALTFDDGPSKYTPQILDILRRNNVKATFCMLGNNVGPYRATARRVVREGHRLCNHSRNHPDFRKLSTAAARSQVKYTQSKIKSVTGRSPKVFRFPYGSSNTRTRAVVRNEGLRILGWTVDTRDWERPGSATITKRAVNNTRPGGVVLMHDGGGNRSQTVASLNNTIRKLKAKGYTFVLA